MTRCRLTPRRRHRRGRKCAPFIETSASIIVLAPNLAPVALHFGIDPVHFGLVMVVNLALGMITPPVGVNPVTLGLRDLVYR